MCWDISLLLLFDWNLHHWLFWFSSLWTDTRITPPCFLSLQFVDDRSWDFSASTIMWNNSSYVSIYQFLICIYLPIYLLVSLSLENSRTILGEYSISIAYLMGVSPSLHATSKRQNIEAYRITGLKNQRIEFRQLQPLESGGQILERRKQGWKASNSVKQLCPNLWMTRTSFVQNVFQVVQLQEQAWEQTTNHREDSLQLSSAKLTTSLKKILNTL